jgi:hypothetical protein
MKNDLSLFNMNKKLLRLFFEGLFFGIVLTLTVPLAAQSLPMQKYYAGLSVLPSNKLLSIAKAQNLYFRTFKNMPPATCDSGYILFEDFIIVALDSIDFELPFKSKDEAYLSKLKLAGLLVVDNGRFVTVKPDMNYFLSGFRPYLSAFMNNYLEMVNTENKLGFIEEDSLFISRDELARRVIFWDKFYSFSLAEKFVLAPEVKGRLDRYIQSLVFGEPFSLVWNANGSLLDEVKNALTAARNSATTDSTKKILDDYWTILEGCNFSKCNKALNFSW